MDKEPERYYEWILWKLRKEKDEKVCPDNTGTTRNRKDNNSSEDSGEQSEEGSGS